MSRALTLDRVTEAGLIAVLRAPDAAGAVKAADTLLGAGIQSIEVTYTTPDAEEALSEIAKRHAGEVLLGAGTVLTAEQAEGATRAGASFLVSPGLDEELVGAMRSTGLLVMAGALTPTEVIRAVAFGVDVVKVFPGSLGGPSYLRALRGPFPEVPFVPTGGVSPENVEQWFAAGALAVGAGGELAPASAIGAGEFESLGGRAERFLQALERVHGRGSM